MCYPGLGLSNVRTQWEKLISESDGRYSAQLILMHKFVQLLCIAGGVEISKDAFSIYGAFSSVET